MFNRDKYGLSKTDVEIKFRKKLTRPGRISGMERTLEDIMECVGEIIEENNAKLVEDIKERLLEASKTE